WARAKSSFKALQYMALGIPAIASPVGMNREVIRDGENGFLPREPRAWVEVLDRLLSNPPLRARVGIEGRRTVEREFSLGVVSHRLVGILERVGATLPTRRHS
ncbi:MAG: glycosyltransferase, partial [Acidobacteria bacterium]|nr:glycosyltransferase [Acidobacteriota bacterium]